MTERFFVTICAEVEAKDIDSAPKAFAKHLREGRAVDMTVEDQESSYIEPVGDMWFLFADGEFSSWPLDPDQEA